MNGIEPGSQALRNPTTWEMITGIRIADPGGWRGEDGRPWTDPITREEFERRAALSTTHRRRES